MTVASGFPGFGAIHILSPPGDCDDHGGATPGAFPDPARNFVAVHARHPDVHEHHMRPECLDDIDGPDAVVNGQHFVSLQAQDSRHRARGILVVVDDQDPLSARARWFVLVQRVTSWSNRSRLGNREPHGEHAALAAAIAFCDHRAAMHFDEAFDQCESDPKAARCALVASIDLREHVEYAGQRLGRYPDARILDRDDRLVSVLLARQPYPTATLGVLGAVGQQVREHLCESCQVGIEHWIARRGRHQQLVSRCLDRWARSFDGVVDDVLERYQRTAQLHLVLADPRDVEEVVDQAHHMPQLALHHRAGLGDGVGITARQPHHLEAVAQRRQRIAQFMREQRQEFVLATVGNAQGFFRLPAFGDVVRQSEDARQSAPRIGQRPDARVDPYARSVLAPGFDFPGPLHIRCVQA